MKKMKAKQREIYFIWYYSKYSGIKLEYSIFYILSAYPRFPMKRFYEIFVAIRKYYLMIQNLISYYLNVVSSTMARQYLL